MNYQPDYKNSPAPELIQPALLRQRNKQVFIEKISDDNGKNRTEDNDKGDMLDL
jgi:hypothetical protein